MVATVSTAHGIETPKRKHIYPHHLLWLQQHLPFTVLKRTKANYTCWLFASKVATVHTVHGMRRRV